MEEQIIDLSTQAIAGLRLLDNDLMTRVFNKNLEATELMLNIILQREDLK